LKRINVDTALKDDVFLELKDENKRE